MRHALLLGCGLAAVIGLAACHKTGSNANQDVTNPGQSAPVNTVQDVAAMPVGQGSAVSNIHDAQGYAQAAAMADLYEIEAGKIAVARAKDPKVKAFGQMMIDDHTKLAADMKAALAKAGLSIAPPAGLDERRKGLLDNLRAAGDADFDLAYLHQQLAAHLEALTLHKGYSTAGDNADLKAAAGTVVPKVQMHIDHIREIGGDKLKDATS
jgi:putative membrane protein